ncbi:hypothetical protein ZHAS_00021270 [Anopheles sinensis]|uniref:Uncharacterized protein n=1 Tax=Anopheles sinensis TaxID=74873 RepID=A0A084WRY6_ANOSI|nr:hypothetical protein ZHAS_00021270 [Anopheles sinensis]
MRQQKSPTTCLFCNARDEPGNGSKTGSKIIKSVNDNVHSSASLPAIPHIPFLGTVQTRDKNAQSGVPFVAREPRREGDYPEHGSRALQRNNNDTEQGE